MRSTMHIFVAALVAVVFTTDAMAMYHPGLGRFVQRDPHGTHLDSTIQMNRVAGNKGSVRPNFIPRIAFSREEGYISSSAISVFLSRETEFLEPAEIGFNVQKQYLDGMSLYQSYKSNPAAYNDPSGLRVAWWTRGNLHNNSSVGISAGGDYLPNGPDKPSVEWSVGLGPGQNSRTLYEYLGDETTQYLYDWDFILPTAGVDIYTDECCQTKANLCDARKKKCPNGEVNDGKIKAFHQKTIHDCPDKPGSVYIASGWTDY